VNVSNALLVLTTLIIGSPAILWLDGPIMQALVTGAAGVAVVSCTMRPGEAIFFVSFARPAALLAAVPALWMLIQVVPMGLFAHPIWASAQAALGHPILGSISIDVGAGALALGRYLTIVAIGFWTAAAAVWLEGAKGRRPDCAAKNRDGISARMLLRRSAYQSASG
jgi:hypothetical protein